MTCSPSALRYWLTARTSNSCSSGSPAAPGRNGPASYPDSQVTYGDPLTEHWKVAPGWSEWNSKVAVYEPVGSDGPESMIVSGSPVVVQTNGSVSLGPNPRSRPAGVGSTVGISPASSARTHSQCWPESRASRSHTASHASHVVGSAGGVPSPHEHSNVSTGSSLAKAKVTSGPEFSGSG